MVANQSKHTMHFTDLAWPEDVPQLPQAWMVGRYLERYMDRYLSSNPDFDLQLSTKVVCAEPRDGGASGWDVQLQSQGEDNTKHFDQVIVASGYFGKPVVPKGVELSPSSSIPIIHSSQYRDLKTLFGERASANGRILVVGGQMSGVEIAGTIGAHLSSARYSPDKFSVPDIDKCTIEHIIQRPIWVFPTYTTCEVSLCHDGYTKTY